MKVCGSPTGFAPCPFQFAEGGVIEFIESTIMLISYTCLLSVIEAKLREEAVLFRCGRIHKRRGVLRLPEAWSVV
jgi:hypothetical protein